MTTSPVRECAPLAAPTRCDRRFAPARTRPLVGRLARHEPHDDPATSSERDLGRGACSGLAEGYVLEGLGWGPVGLRRTGPPAEIPQVAPGTDSGHCRHRAHGPPSVLQVLEPVRIRLARHCRPIESLPVHAITCAVEWGRAGT